MRVEDGAAKGTARGKGGDSLAAIGAITRVHDRKDRYSRSRTGKWSASPFEELAPPPAATPASS
jgi:hypothetical protein